MAENKPSILVVDDESSIRESFELILRKEFNVITASSGEAAIKKMIDAKVDLIYLDIRMPGMNGIDTLKRIKSIDPAVDVIMVTAINDISSAGTAVKVGAKDYVLKPFDVEDILNKTRSIIIKSQAKNINLFEQEDLIGSSKHILEIEKTIAKESGKDTSILIQGEKGTEAELIARIISVESERTIRTINVTANFDDAELFGYEKGSFLNAFRKESGALEEMNGGILFIRNIELLPHETQLKLRGTLRKKQLLRQGSSSPMPLNVRIISEASENLKELADNGAFDGELYSMLSEVNISLPPVREREGDAPILINYYIDKFNKKHGLSIKGVSQEAFEILVNYPWPGNITEIANTIEALVLSARGEEIAPDDLPIDITIKSEAAPKNSVSMEHLTSVLERMHVLNIYHRTGQNINETSNILGIQPNALETRIESYTRE